MSRAASPVNPEWVIGIALLLVITVVCTCLIVGVRSRAGGHPPILPVLAGIVLSLMLWNALSNLFEGAAAAGGPGGAPSSMGVGF